MFYNNHVEKRRAGEWAMEPNVSRERRPKPVQVILDEDGLKAVDDWRRQQSSIPSRAQAIRMLVRKGLECEMAAAR